MIAEESKEREPREITIKYQGEPRAFLMPPKHKFEEYKYMLEDTFKFETFARRLTFRINNRPIESLDDLKPPENQGKIVIEMQTEEMGA